MAEKAIATVTIEVRARVSLWEAIKLRIAGPEVRAALIALQGPITDQKREPWEGGE